MPIPTATSCRARELRRPNPPGLADDLFSRPCGAVASPFALSCDTLQDDSGTNSRLWLAVGGLAIVCIGGAVAYWLASRDPGDPRLNGFVRARPPVPIVFTSRSEPASLIAAAPEGEGFTAPGQRLWAAREGRLRL